MTITVTCPVCDQKLRVGDEKRGKRVKCPSCGDAVRIVAKDDDVDDDEPVTRTRTTKSRKGKSSKSAGNSPSTLIIAIGAGAAVIIVAVMVLVLMQPGRNASQNSVNPVATGTNPSPAATVQNLTTPNSNGPIPASNSEKSYQERRANFKTRLTHTGPSPQEFGRDRPPLGISEVMYPSGSLMLKAWVAYPKGASSDAKVPAVIYFHGGFAFGLGDFNDALPFLNAGYALMCPMLRGENGNPGAFEFYAGEVDDAKAAIAWLGSQAQVDPTHIYTFGHSAGGVVSALLSLHDVPVRHTGSAGGLYGTSLFDHMGPIVPFAINDLNERQMRVLVGNVKWMQRPHYAFAGTTDSMLEVAAAQREIQNGQPLLKISMIPGDHHSSLAPAVAAYVKVIKENP